ncbi:MAG: hypothetical protein R3Y32_06900 [Bacillota bacterium]
MNNYIYINQNKKRDKLVRELSNQLNSVEAVERFLTDKVYSELTGIRIPLPDQERAIKRFTTMKRNDINKILASIYLPVNDDMDEQSIFESLYLL